VNKTRWLDFAQVFDQLRIVPRVTLFGYAAWVIHIIDKTLGWYMNLPTAERTLEASGLATAIISVITGLFPWIYRIYSDNATDWSVQIPSSKTQTVVQTTEVSKP
jgi:hypothetical protein